MCVCVRILDTCRKERECKENLTNRNIGRITGLMSVLQEQEPTIFQYDPEKYKSMLSQQNGDPT